MKSAVWPVKEIKWSGWVSDNILSANGEWSGGKDERDTGANAQDTDSHIEIKLEGAPKQAGVRLQL